MTLKGKVFMCTTFLFMGMFIGGALVYSWMDSNSNTGNQVNVTVDGKVKKGSEVNIELESDQEQKKEKKWWKLF
ncbi:MULTISPECIES: hypothetical protein [unclassified Carboxylicivirga]|uniref:hypothetical protein n=1 Tax=Carboxylicivirga TaxID=1628153 RepID=UPI003D349DBC